jgi:site-specific DNA recombinase
MRTATYSRYSSDNQRETSVEDQERLQSARAAAEGWPIILRFSDREVSASTPMGLRPGGKALLHAAERLDFDVLIVEGLDRCWRDIVDQERTLRRLEYLGIRVIGVSDAYDTRHEDRELQRGVRGLLNQQYLRDLAKKTHRGLTGQIHRGGHAGGLSYGYKSVPAGAVHRLEVDPAQAEWVRWIFARYAEGWSCQRIAHELNKMGIKTARGTTWGVSALYGCPRKGSGVLNNELYIGRYIWNRSQWIKDENGKRTRRDRPQAEWLIEDKPELRIVGDEAWQAARARIGEHYLEGGSAGRGGRPRTLFGGLFRCGHCGGSIIAVNRDHYGCQIHKDRGSAVCPGVSIRRELLERRVMTEVREGILSFEAIAHLMSAVKGVRDELLEEMKLATAAAKARIVDVDIEIGNLVNAIAAVGISDALRTRLSAAEAERAGLESIANAPLELDLSAEGILPSYKRLVLNLGATLESEKDVARPLLKDIFEGSKVASDESGPYMDLALNQASLLAKAAGADCFLGLVAGARFQIQKRVRFQ